MKKIISMVLCIIMCVSVFSTTAVPALAAGTATSLLKVEASDYAYDTITYTISLSPNQTKVSGVIVQAIYDPAVMKVEDCHPVGSYNNNGEIEAAIPGIFTNGPLKGSDNIHSMAFVGNGYTVGSKAEGLYEITHDGDTLTARWCFQPSDKDKIHWHSKTFDLSLNENG